MLEGEYERDEPYGINARRRSPLQQTAFANRISIQLSHPFPSSKLLWPDRSLERLVERLTLQASLAVDPGKPVRIAIRQRRKMRDMEKFFEIQPSHWIQLRIARRGTRWV